MGFLMSDDIKKVHDALGEIKSMVDEKTKDVVTEEKFKKVSDDLVSLQEKAQAAERETLALKAAFQQAGVKEDKNGLSDIEKKEQEVLEAFVRKGDEAGFAELEQKDMGSYSSADGGYLVPRAMSATIIKRVFETSPVRAVASVQSISTDSVDFLIDDNELDQGWVSETATRSVTSTPELGKKTIAVHEQYAQPQVTQRLLDDAAFSIETWLADKVSDKFARTENTAFVSGNGSGQPRGFLDYDAGSATYNREQIEQVNLGAAAALTGNGLIELQNSLKDPYQSGAVFMMKRSGYGELLKLMYTDNKFDALTPSAGNGAELMLLGKRIILADDMPAVAANALSVAYGNFAVGYQIVDRLGISLLRDPYTAKPYVKFYFTKRVGGDVLNTEAIKIGKIAA